MAHPQDMGLPLGGLLNIATSITLKQTPALAFLEEILF
jgi:hypothetical protein